MNHTDKLVRYPVIGSMINATTKEMALDTVRNAVESGRGGYVCFANVHTTVMARQSPEYKTVLQDSLLSLPDGRPLYWTGRARGVTPLEHLPGPDFMPYFMDAGTGWAKHYFYGSTDATLELLRQQLSHRYPSAKIVGMESPPFRPLTETEQQAALARIRASGANVVWVGLGAPKQENWMHDNWEALRPAVLMGVGAAFDFHAGTLARAPEWMSGMGMEWLYRLLREPRRLARRYGVTNSLFLYYSILDFMRRG